MKDYNCDDEPNLTLQQQRQLVELSFLFGSQTVEHASLLDVVDLNLNDEMTASIGNGVNKLKHLKNNPEAQQKLINAMEAGERLLICLWIMEMGMLDKIQDRPYTQE